jgi:hypothetical protein
MSCPSGFDIGVANTCRVTCPTDYKFISDQGVDKCVSGKDNRYSVKLQPVAQGADQSVFTAEQSRFLTDFIVVTKQVQKDQDAADRLAAESSDSDVQANYGRIQSSAGLTNAYTEAIATLKPLRPPTQPTVDIMNERLSIKEISTKDIRVIQICLFFVVICLLEYMLFSAETVHGIAFITMCVGLSLAIYLSNR